MAPEDPLQNDPITDRDRIRAAGRPVVLADGREIPLRFGLDELCRLEDTFGSLVAFQEAINDTKHGGNGPFLTTLRKSLAVCLARHGITDEDLDDLFDLGQRWAYRGALIDAYNEAMPPAETSGKGSAGTNPSRGATSTTQAPSVSAAAMSSSGV